MAPTASLDLRGRQMEGARQVGEGLAVLGLAEHGLDTHAPWASLRMIAERPIYAVGNYHRRCEVPRQQVQLLAPISSYRPARKLGDTA